MSARVVDWPHRISSDHDVVDRFLADSDGQTVDRPTIADMHTAIEWLALYGAESEEEAAPYIRVIALLQAQVDARQHRVALARAKRDYATTHGVPVASVRIAR